MGTHLQLTPALGKSINGLNCVRKPGQELGKIVNKFTETWHNLGKHKLLSSFIKLLQFCHDQFELSLWMLYDPGMLFLSSNFCFPLS